MIWYSAPLRLLRRYHGTEQSPCILLSVDYDKNKGEITTIRLWNIVVSFKAHESVHYFGMLISSIEAKSFLWLFIFYFFFSICKTMEFLKRYVTLKPTIIPNKTKQSKPNSNASLKGRLKCRCSLAYSHPKLSVGGGGGGGGQDYKM